MHPHNVSASSPRGETTIRWARRVIVACVFGVTASAPLWWHAGASAVGLRQERQQQQGQAQPDAQQMAEMMQKYEEAARPGEFHGKLKSLAGRWQVTAEFGGPEGTMTSRGQATNEMVLGDRFLKQEFNGEMMGRQFEGIGYTGYDNTGRQYQSVWLDSMSSAMFMTEGEVDEGGNVISFTGEAMCPLTNQMKRFRHVLRIEGDDRYLFEMYEPGENGEMTRTTTMTYTRIP